MDKVLYSYAKKNTKINLYDENETEEFKEEYRKFLNTLWEDIKNNKKNYKKNPNRGIYFDPDSFAGKNRGNPLFYEDLCKFLNSSLDYEKYKYVDNFIECNGVKLYSDQFGFSAPCTNLNHIYDKYLEVSQKLGKDKDETIEKVIKWVMESRTVGGSFIWPNVKGSKKTYNFRRGGSCYGGSYIEDRVDLTLLEIRNYFKKTSTKYDILPSCEEERKWLDSFGSFENYVDELKFKAFVDKNYMPYDIVNSDFAEGNKKVIDESEVDYKKKHSIYIVEDERDYLGKIERMLNNVNILINERFKEGLGETNQE